LRKNCLELPAAGNNKVFLKITFIATQNLRKFSIYNVGHAQYTYISLRSFLQWSVCIPVDSPSFTVFASSNGKMIFTVPVSSQLGSWKRKLENQHRDKCVKFSRYLMLLDKINIIGEYDGVIR
jgi:hypothetical protein